MDQNVTDADARTARRAPTTRHATRYQPLATLIETGADRRSTEVLSPFDGATIGTVPVCTAGDVQAAAARARRAQRSWAGTPIKERTAVIRRFADLVLDHQAELLDLVQVETGKSRSSGFEELVDVSRVSSYYANSAAGTLRTRRRRGAIPLLTRAVELHRPKGVVGIITPWNYPLTLPATDAVPALLAGNAIVLKPDSQTPFTALWVLQLLLDAGLPDGLLNIVTGPGPDIGPPLIDNVDFLMFTGSTSTGRTVAEQCASRLIGFSAELGGKNPLLVLSDADVDRAAGGAVNACFSNAGQLCISIERIYVHDAVYDRFVDAFIDRVEAMRLGAGHDWEIDMGSLTSQQQLDTVTDHVNDAVAKGAEVLTGGRARPDLGPFFYEPTVLAGVAGDMTVARDETFGPVVSIYRVHSDDEAIARANDTDYGLNASVWSRQRGMTLAPAVQSGTVNINEGYAATWGSYDAPMGGMKDSGVGRRHGRQGMLKYTEPQTISQQRLIPVGPPGWISYEQYAHLMTRAVRVLNRFA